MDLAPPRAPSAAPAGRFAALGRDLLDLVLPVTCLGCGAPGALICARCAVPWSGPPRRCEHGAPRLDRLDGSVLPVWALAENHGTVRRVVVTWKDRGRADATPALAALLGRATATLTGQRGPALPGVAGPAAEAVPRSGGARPTPSPTSGPALPRDGPLVVVPAPTSRRGRADRGEDLVAALARACAAHGPPGSVAVPVLRLARGGRDQVGLGLRGRAENLAGRVRARPRRAATLRGARVLLVDDVLTTGATLAACRAAVEACGGRPVGALVLAVTRPPGVATAWLVEGADAG